MLFERINIIPLVLFSSPHNLNHTHMASYTPKTRKLYTLIFPLGDGRVLLGYKKRRFGQGKCELRYYHLVCPFFFRLARVYDYFIPAIRCALLPLVLANEVSLHPDNGFGGKVEVGETIAEGAIRELEVCITITRSAHRENDLTDEFRKRLVSRLKICRTMESCSWRRPRIPHRRF